MVVELKSYANLSNMNKLSSSVNKELRFSAEKVGVSLTPEQTEKLIEFNELLNKWTKRFNLVSVNSLDNSISRHVLDALSIGPYIQKPSDCDELHKNVYDLLDVGSGAGLPVLPLAISYPTLKFLSVEPNGKKERFQRQVILELGLKNLDVINERIESVQRQANNVTSRAFTAPNRFLELTTEQCVPGGRGIIMLGQAERMPTSLPTPWQLDFVERLKVPGEFGERHVALCIRGTLVG